MMLMILKLLHVVTIQTIVSKLSFAKIEFSYRVVLNGEIMASGSTLHGFVDAVTFHPVSLKKQRSELYEKLKEMVVTEWPE